MPTTDHSTIPGSSRRPRWLLPVVVLTAVAVVAGAVLAVLLIGSNGEAPEDVVAQSIEAWNARDRDTLEALYDPEIASVYDASAVGSGEYNTDLVGREVVLDSLQETWREWDPTIISHEVLEVDGGTVTTMESVTFFTGDTNRQQVVYEVSDEGLIVGRKAVVAEWIESSG